MRFEHAGLVFHVGLDRGVVDLVERMHRAGPRAAGHDLITSLPFVMLDEVKGEPYDMTMQPGMAYGIEITPVSADGTFGIFLSRSFAITEGGVQALTPYPVEDFIIAG